MLRQLQEQRSGLADKMRAMLNTPTGADLDDTQAAEFDKMKGELSALDAKIERAALVADLERRETGTSITGGDNFETRAQQASLTKLIAAQAGEQVDAGLEREVSQELARRMGVKPQGLYYPMETRVITSTLPATGPGGTLIPTDYRPQDFIDRLRAASILPQVGATTLSGLSGNVTIPGLKASVSTGWVAENTALPVSDQEYRSVTLTPKHCGVISEFSRNMLLQSSPYVENLLRDDMAKQLAEALDLAAIDGPGGVAPTGLLQMTGLATLAPVSPISYDTLADLAALPENADSQGTGYLTNTKVKAHLLKILTADGLPIGLPVLFGGYPFHFSNLVPDGTVLFGRWSDLLIGLWSALDILVNPYDSEAYKKGNVMVRAMMTCDVAVRHLESFAAAVEA
ncbi:MAG: phage major capsid protein [Candidatus Adiutrix sp.]|jgi:HK97 family phage major capsid protein|nr:phage major capsid protein [Candidatus Adiutrix sp.]